MKRLNALAAIAALSLGSGACDEEKKVEPPPPFTEVLTRFDKPLTAVWVLSATDVWAVGRAGLLVHFDGTKWAATDSPTTQNLIALWGTEGQRLWAVGEAGTILEFKDGEWTVTTLREAVTLRAIAGTGPDDVWALGDELIAYHNTGEGWEKVVVDLPEAVHGAFMDDTGTGLFVGAESRTGTVTARYEGETGTWTRVVRSDTGVGAVDDLWGRIEPGERVPFIWGAGVNTAGNGLLMRWQDDAWRKVADGLPDRPKAVLPTAEGIWLGASGRLMLLDPEDPEGREDQLVTAPVADLQGVDGLIVAVGGASDGRVWTRVPDSE